MKELILMYAPTFMVAVTTVVGFFKNAAQLRNNVNAITKSAELSSLKKEVEQLRKQLSCTSSQINACVKELREVKNDKENDSVSEEA